MMIVYNQTFVHLYVDKKHNKKLMSKSLSIFLGFIWCIHYLNLKCHIQDPWPMCAYKLKLLISSTVLKPQRNIFKKTLSLKYE
jgi:hypothetical protein